ncbi:hypothetical protein SO802_019512 [Lithocarpus litseifolius]|uniref:Uncharacterized protein n=1 Tax=Lithocarpus litseifolius TaxID=425828 RepID=A0AAW2CNZ3_9ROSI
MKASFVLEAISYSSIVTCLKVACTSMKRNEVLILTLDVSSEPVEVLRTRQTVTVHGSDSHKGLSDIAFTSIDDSRLVKESD